MSHIKALFISSESGDASASEVNLNLESVSALIRGLENRIELLPLRLGGMSSAVCRYLP